MFSSHKSCEIRYDLPRRMRGRRVKISWKVNLVKLELFYKTLSKKAFQLRAFKKLKTPIKDTFERVISIEDIWKIKIYELRNSRKTFQKVFSKSDSHSGLSSVWPPEECSTLAQQENFLFNKDISLFFLSLIQRWFHSIIHICWLRKKVVQKQIPITFLNRSDISFSDGWEHHLMGVISGMSRRRFGRKSHFTPSWRWKHNKLLWSHLTLGIENYVY